MRTALRPVPIDSLQRGFGWIYARAASPRAGILDPSTLHEYGASHVDRARLFGLSVIARNLLAELRTVQLRRLLPRLTVPVLQVWGRHDRLVPSRRITQSEGTVMLAGCGHCPQLDSPDQLLEAVVPFLAADAASAVPDLLARAAGS